MVSSQIISVLLQSVVAILIAFGVTVRIANTALRKDLLKHRYRVFEGTAEFIQPILASPDEFVRGNEEHRKFWRTMQRAEMLFESRVPKYLEEVDETVGRLWASNVRRASNRGDVEAPTESEAHIQRLTELYLKRVEIFRSETAIQPARSGSIKYLPYVALGVAAGLLIGFSLGERMFRKVSPPSAVHRVFVSYPSRWDVGEFRNCALGRPQADVARWPQFHCDDRGSSSDATHDSHAFVMDVQFLGDFKVPSDKTQRPWTCQSGGAGELTCKDW